MLIILGFDHTDRRPATPLFQVQ
ncbi:uncharacterized protein METZ01_LOCUS204552, partial [marine metagenome]